MSLKEIKERILNELEVKFYYMTEFFLTTQDKSNFKIWLSQKIDEAVRESLEEIRPTPFFIPYQSPFKNKEFDTENEEHVFAYDKLANQVNKNIDDFLK
jgi:hypothetical protein